MKINKINNIYFKSNSQPTAPLSQQQQNKVNFEKERKIAEKADSIDANPITSLGYKLLRTYRFITANESSPAQQQNLNVAA